MTLTFEMWEKECAKVLPSHPLLPKIKMANKSTFKINFFSATVFCCFSFQQNKNKITEKILVGVVA